MPRLTFTEIECHRKRLIDWQSPQQMLTYVTAVNKGAGRFFLIQSGLDFLRDAWIASTFGETVGATFVRLVKDEWPDFELRFPNGEIQSFECTEADVPGRKRGQEFREAERQVGPNLPFLMDDPVENWIARADSVCQALRSAAEKKAAKKYSGKAALVIYLNISEFGIKQREIESCFGSSTSPARKSFNEVWILWKVTVYKMWDQGQPSTLRVTTPNKQP